MIADEIRIIGIEKSERPVIQGQAQDGHIVGVHHAMGEARRLPLRHQLGGALDHFAEPAGMVAGEFRKIFADDMIGQQPHLFVLAAMMEMLEMAEADMASAPGG